MIRTCQRCSTIARLRGGDWDFNLALGPNWGKAAKAASKTSTLQPLVKALQKLRATTPSTFKRLLKTSPDKYAELADSV